MRPSRIHSLINCSPSVLIVLYCTTHWAEAKGHDLSNCCAIARGFPKHVINSGGGAYYRGNTRRNAECANIARREGADYTVQ